MRKKSQNIETSNILEYLKGFMELKSRMNGNQLKDFHYQSLEEFFIKHGTFYKSQTMSKEEMDLLKRLIKYKNKYKPKECFYNAQSIAQENLKILYVEGFLFSGFFPIQHGWNTLNGKVIDFTMKHANGGNPILGIIPNGWEYFGIPLSTLRIFKLWSDHGMSMPLVDNHLTEYELLRKPFNQEEEMEYNQ